MLKDGYNKMVPPIEMAPDRTMIPVTVDVSIVLLKIVEIEEENHAIEFQYEIIMKWRDNRLAYHNLKRDTSLNALPEADFKKLWLPLVIYENTDQKVSHLRTKRKNHIEGDNTSRNGLGMGYQRDGDKGRRLCKERARVVARD